MIKIVNRLALVLLLIYIAITATNPTRENYIMALSLSDATKINPHKVTEDMPPGRKAYVQKLNLDQTRQTDEKARLKAERKLKAEAKMKKSGRNAK